jgi:hypothetical protein
MVHNTQNHWVFGLRPLPGILNNRKTTLRLALCKESNRGGVSFISPDDGNGSSFRNLVFSSFLELADNGQNP